MTPYWPQANSEVERFNRTLEKATRAAHAEGKNWKNEIDIFLLNYRATAHCTTGKAPAVLLFGRNIRTKLPSLSTQTAAAPEEREDSSLQVSLIEIVFASRRWRSMRTRKDGQCLQISSRVIKYSSSSSGNRNCQRHTIQNHTQSKERRVPVFC